MANQQRRLEQYPYYTGLISRSLCFTDAILDTADWIHHRSPPARPDLIRSYPDPGARVITRLELFCLGCCCARAIDPVADIVLMQEYSPPILIVVVYYN
ncbi:hypothetical protein TorRG33x02_269910, partial [Trema orientale]